jgi:hypothetical protein
LVSGGRRRRRRAARRRDGKARCCIVMYSVALCGVLPATIATDLVVSPPLLF